MEKIRKIFNINVQTGEITQGETKMSVIGFEIYEDSLKTLINVYEEIELIIMKFLKILQGTYWHI